MKVKGVGLGGVAFLVCGVGCASLPAPIAQFPKKVDVIKIELDAAELPMRDQFGWPAHGAIRAGKFRRRFEVNSEFSSHSVQMLCTWDLVQEGCSTLTTKCTLEGRDESFALSLRRDGSLALSELNVAPRPSGQKLELIAMNDEEVRGLQYRNSIDAAELLSRAMASQQDEKKLRWGVQLARTDNDPENGERRARRAGVDDLEFNLLAPVGEKAYVSVHAAHPDYELTSALLVTLGHLYVHNAPNFSSCAP